jgi:hypothetical protein
MNSATAVITSLGSANGPDGSTPSSSHNSNTTTRYHFVAATMVKKSQLQLQNIKIMKHTSAAAAVSI